MLGTFWGRVVNIFERAKIMAEIADLGTRAYGLLVDKSRAMLDKDTKIKELEAQIAELKRKVDS